jgi:predicted transcriptional regulator
MEKLRTLTLELSSEEEARIRMNAMVRGQEIKEYLLTLAENDQVIDLTEFEDQADFDDSVAGIREGLADLDAGRTYSFEETFAEMEAHLNNLERQQKANTARQEEAA